MISKLVCFFAFGVATTFHSYAQTSLAPGEHEVILDGVKLWYKVAGQQQSGQAPVLFLHGGPGYNSYSFERTVGTQLERHMRMIYLDERGSGRSERPANHDYTMSTLVADVEALRVSLGVPQLTLMGHSFGGTIALEYAALYPEHTQKLIVLDGASDVPFAFSLWRKEIEGRYPAQWKKALDGLLGEKLRAAEARRDTCAIAKLDLAAEMTTLQSVDGQVFHNWQQFHDQRYQREQRVLDNASGLQNTGEIEGAYFGPESEFPCYRFWTFDRLTMPTLVMVGKYDGAIGEEQMRSLASHLPNARFDVFETSAHFVYAEQPGKFVADVTAFLQAAK